MKNERAGETFAKLLDVMAQLRGDNGCPWDKEQSHASLRPFLLEESHELLDALDKGTLRNPRGTRRSVAPDHFHCQIAAEGGAFTAEDVVRDLKDKMVRRHPHVFFGKHCRTLTPS